MLHQVIPRFVSRPLVSLGTWLALSQGAFASEPFAWSEPSAEAQLAEDQVVIPIGKGALFVPSLTGPINEPPIILVDEDGGEVEDIPTGERVLLDPGRYTVIISSGSPGQGVGQAVEVVEGETTVTEVLWGALRIEVVDDRRVPHRGAYELIKVDTREVYGTGFGADTLQGETLMTWLLPPGVYRIVRPGANYRALRDFATVYVPASGFVRYRLVTDPDTGEFQGAGVVGPNEFGSPSKGKNRWQTNVVLGANGSLVSQQGVVGVSNQTSASGSLFLDGQLTYREDRHLMSGLLQIEEGVSQIRPKDSEPLPLIKTRDRLRADALYTYLLKPSIGPYARVAGETQAFATDVLVTEDTTIVKNRIDGSVDSEFVGTNETFRVASAWEPTIVREGVGLNTRFVNNRWMTFNWRIGVGLRQNRYGGALLLTDQPNTQAVEYLEVPSFDQEGIESTIIATARLPGWAVYATDVEFFADFSEMDKPSIEWRNTLTLRLTRNLSLNYFANLSYLPQVVDDLQIDQSLLIRASWVLF